jgi:hypothetical protein
MKRNPNSNYVYTNKHIIRIKIMVNGVQNKQMKHKISCPYTNTNTIEEFKLIQTRNVFCMMKQIIKLIFKPTIS